MKKVICILICIAAALCLLASCGADGKSGFVRGTVSNNVYCSEFLGLKFSPGPAWNFDDEGSLMEKSGIDPGTLEDGEELSKALSECASIYDMMAEDPYSGTSVTVVYENMGLKLGASGTTVEEYVEKLKSEIETRYSSYNAKVTGLDDCSLGSTTFKSVKVEFEVKGNGLTQYYYVAKTGGYIATVCVSAKPDLDVQTEIIPLFEPLD